MGLGNALLMASWLFSDHSPSLDGTRENVTNKYDFLIEKCVDGG
jgi:hypothetical protein